jgi:DUF971 family protein
VKLTVITEKYELRSMNVAGSYALDVDWGDRHGSIYPFRDLRPRCPCESCRKEPPSREDSRARTPVEVAQEEGALRIEWEDGHVSCYPLPYLRDICQCALCAGEKGPIDMYLGKS